jgi:uncharacterized protein YcfJ
MKYLSIAAILFASVASADSSVKGNVVDYYNNVVVSTPHEKRLCEEYQVPIYGQQGSVDGGDVLMGMIIGGLLGKGVTGQDNGAAAGAVFGGVIAADKGSKKTVIQGYKTETKCRTEVRYSDRTERRYTHSIVTFRYEGRDISVQFQK